MPLEKFGELGTMKPFQKYKRREKHEPHYDPHLRLPSLLASHTLGSSMGQAMGTFTISQLIAVCIIFLNIHILVYS